MMSQGFLTTTTHNVAWFFKRHQQDELQLKAPFQRNPVWTDRQKAFLIDTMLRGYPIPELYIQVKVDAEGKELYTVVDGQQRLRACFEFLSGDITFDGDDSPDFADMKFSDLSEAQRKTLFGYNFVVRILPDMPDADLRAMFTRLNRNVVALNSQELRHATYWGNFIHTMEKLADESYWPRFGIFTPNDVRRMLDIEFISELAIGYLHGLQNKKENLDSWYQAYEKSFDRDEEVRQIFLNVTSEFLSILPNFSDTRWRKKSDFYSLFLLFTSQKDCIPFSRDGRNQLQRILLEFGAQVDSYLSDPSAGLGETDVAKYAIAVERAASDLGNRKERNRVLMSLTNRVFEAERESRRS